MIPTLMSFLSWQQEKTKNFDFLAFLIVMSVCLLSVSNGLASIGMQLAFILVIYLYPTLFRQWWIATRYFLLVAVLILLVLVANSFNYKQALQTACNTPRFM